MFHHSRPIVNKFIRSILAHVQRVLFLVKILDCALTIEVTLILSNKLHFFFIVHKHVAPVAVFISTWTQLVDLITIDKDFENQFGFFIYLIFK